MSEAFLPSVQPIRIDLAGRDLIEAFFASGVWKIKVTGCWDLEDKINTLLKTQPDLTKWAEPTGSAHEDLLIIELIRKAKGQWTLPYQEEELCHCRSVPTSIVEQAIIAGAHTCKSVSAQTSASTACGTCRPDVQKIIDYRLGLPVKT